MRKDAYRSEFTTLEHEAVTVLRMTKDMSGKQTVDRTYVSIRRKVNQLDKNSDNLTLKDASKTGKNMSTDRSKKQQSVKKFIQLCLFQISEP
jgi:hypothetical protein